MRKDTIDGYHVEVSPSICRFARSPGEQTELERRACDEIQKDIRRHIDDVGSVIVVAETSSTCEFCGYAWTESSEYFNGGCCDKDIEAEDQRTGKEFTP